MSTSISRNAQVLRFFANADRGIPRKRLVKMAYLADVLALEYLGHPISEFPWISYHYGPYAFEIKDAVEELEKSGLAWTKDTDQAPDGATWKRLYLNADRVTYDFDLAENEILAYVVSNYLSVPMDELMDGVVYQSAPYVNRGEFRQPLPMETSRDVGRKKAGFDLGKIVKAEQQVRDGHFTSGREFFDDLRTRITARHAS